MATIEDLIPPDECFEAYVNSGCTPGALPLKTIKRDMQMQGGMTRTTLHLLIQTHRPANRVNEPIVLRQDAECPPKKKK